MSKKLEDLHTRVKELALQLIELAKREGITLSITSTLRTFAEQDKLYEQGRTTAGKKITNSKGGQSWHNFGCAFDVVPMIDGKAIWDNKKLWQTIGQLGKSINLIWGGDFKKVIDSPHFEYHPNLVLAQALANHRDKKDILIV